MNKMNFKVFGRIGQFLTVGIIAISAISCDSDDDKVDPNDDRADEYFNIVYTSSHTGNTEAYIQALTNPSEGVVTFNKFGYEIPSTRTPRVYASNDGRIAYNVDYGGGTLSSFDVYGGQDYRITNQKVISNVLGSEYARGTKVSDENILIHSVNSYKHYNSDSSAYLYYKADATILNVDLDGLVFKEVAKFELVANEEDKKKGLYIFRIDAPAVSNGKAYYGFGMSYRDPVTGESAPDGFVRPTYKSQSLVVDYPSLENPKIITSNVSEGSTYGYRIPVSHIDESGDVYQITQTHMLKIKDGKYDDTYVFDLSKAGIGARGWFYAGNGIGYATIFDLEEGSGSDAWGIARIDIIKKEVIKMNVDGGLSLSQYQMAKVGKDGKVYMALSPVGEEGYIYIFDPKMDNADGFVKGAKLTNHGSKASYVGVF